MNDPTILDMLTAARALHERGEYSLDQCDTCTGGNSYASVKWPCDTAKALGATGASEWTTPTRPKVTRHWTGTTTCEQPRPDNGDRQYITICNLLADHDGKHADRDGGTW